MITMKTYPTHLTNYDVNEGVMMCKKNLGMSDQSWGCWDKTSVIWPSRIPGSYNKNLFWTLQGSKITLKSKTWWKNKWNFHLLARQDENNCSGRNSMAKTFWKQCQNVLKRLSAILKSLNRLLTVRDITHTSYVQLQYSSGFFFNFPPIPVGNKTEWKD